LSNFARLDSRWRLSYMFLGGMGKTCRASLDWADQWVRPYVFLVGFGVR
jgi:hypothetical protein